jgi:hypothetical protein
VKGQGSSWRHSGSNSRQGTTAVTSVRDIPLSVTGVKDVTNAALPELPGGRQ